MMNPIVSLPKDQYKGFKIPIQYVTWEHLRVDLDEIGGVTEIRLVPTRFEAPKNKSYEMEFYPPYYENAEAYGVFDKKDLIAAIEVSEETWNKRLSVT